MRVFQVFCILFAVILGGCGDTADTSNNNVPTPSPPPLVKKTIGIATFVDHVVLNTIRDSLLNELKELGYTKSTGWNVVVMSANGEPANANAVANDLLNLKPDVIVSISTPSTKPVFDNNGGRFPHVYSFVSFPDSIGIDENSTNTTGLSDSVDFVKCFDLIQKVIPDLKTLGMVYSDEPNAVISRDAMVALAKKRGVQFLGQSVAKESEVKAAVQDLAARDVDAFFIGADGLVVSQVPAMAEVARNAKIPVFATDEGSVKTGALIALSVDYARFGKETADVVDKVIKSGSADSVPDVRYLGSRLVINTTTAKAIGLTISPEILSSAAQVVE